VLTLKPKNEILKGILLPTYNSAYAKPSDSNEPLPIHYDFAYAPQINQICKKWRFDMLSNSRNKVANFLTQHRIFFRILMIFIAGTVGIFIGSYSPLVESGTVEYKLITGQDANKQNVMLLDMGNEIVHTDRELECYITPNCRNLTVDGCLEHKLCEDYTDVQYRVAVRLKGNVTKSYNVPKEVFNSLAVDATAQYEIDRPHGARIKRLVASTTQTNIMTRRDYPVLDNWGQYMQP
jgi:hypothetical protein